MTRLRWLLIGSAAIALMASGAVVAGGQQEGPPQDARPSADPIGDALREDPRVEAAPAADPAPAVPIAITPPPPPASESAVETASDDDEKEASAEDEDEGESAEDKAKRLAAETPARRQRRRVAVIEAIDKITAESMRFEVEVGGPPVRFSNNLIITARACEISADNELVKDAIAYLDVTLQPRTQSAGTPRQIFRGWMFASTPAISGLQHPLYDAWVVGCKA